MRLFDWLFGKRQAARQVTPTVVASARDAQPAPGDVVIELSNGRTVCVLPGKSLTIGSGPDVDCRVEDCSVAPRHVRIDNKVIPPGYDSSHPYCNLVWVADIGGSSVGDELFGPRSRTGVVNDISPRFVMPLELGETAPLSKGTVVLLGELQLRILCAG